MGGNPSRRAGERPRLRGVAESCWFTQPDDAPQVTPRIRSRSRVRASLVYGRARYKDRKKFRKQAKRDLDYVAGPGAVAVAAGRRFFPSISFLLSPRSWRASSASA